MIRKLLFLFAFICIISSAYSVTTIGTLPYTISTPGEYNISGNLSSTGHAITITTQNVSLNCEGYTMTGDGGASDYAIVINGDAYDYNNISNCNFFNFSSGFYLYEGDYNNFSNLNINSTTSGIYFVYGTADYNYFTNITINHGFNFYTGTTNEFLGRIYFNNVSDGNGKYLISFISTTINIDGWTNISGIYLYDSDNSVIQNLNINGEDKYSQAVFLHTYHSNNVTFTNISVTNYRIGFFVSGWFNDQINLFNLNLSNGYYGLYHIGSYINSNNISLNNYTQCILKTGYSLTINNSYFNNCNYLIQINQQAGNTYIYNTIYSNSIPIFEDQFNSASTCNNIFQNVTDENGKYFLYSNQSININGWANNLSYVYLCNADNSTITNLNYNGINKTKTFFTARFTDYSNFTNLNFSNYIYGVYLYKSNYNFLNNTNTSNNSQYGFHIYQSDYNTITNFNSSFNSHSGVYLTQGSDYNYLNNFNSHYNTWYGVIAVLSSNNYNNYSNFNVYNNGFGSGLYLQSGTGSIARNFTSYKNSRGVLLEGGSNYQLLDNFTVYNNTDVGIYILSSSNYNNISNFNSFYNQQSGIFISGSTNNILNNFSSHNNTQHGVYLSTGSNNSISNFNSYNNTLSGLYLRVSSNNNTITNFSTYYNLQAGIYFFTSSLNNILTNFSSYNNANGIYFFSGSSNNTFLNGTSINNTNYNLYFSQSGALVPQNNTFYNNHLGNISKIYSDNWTNINYFNYTIPGVGNIGNYWNDFGVCSVKTVVGTYGVCANPANYTLNSTNNIYDFAPLYNPYEIDSCTNLTIAGGNYYMTGNILNSATSNCINISANNITFDCRGFTIDGNDAVSNGIIVSRASTEITNLTISNCILSDFTSQNMYILRGDMNILSNITSNSTSGNGLSLEYSSNNSIRSIISKNNAYGIRLLYSNYNNFSNLSINTNTQYGIYLFNDLYNNFYNSTFFNNSVGEIYIPSNTNNYCNNRFSNITDTYGNYVLYFNSSININGWTNISSIFLCNADNSTIENLNYVSSYNLKGYFIYALRTDYSNFTNLNSSNYYGPIALYDSSNNILNNLNTNSNSAIGISLTAISNNNSLNNIISYNNSYGFYTFSGPRNNTITNLTTYNNSNTGIYLNSDSYNNTLINFNSSNNFNGIILGGKAINNTLLNGISLNNSNYNLYFVNYVNYWPYNNTFYNNHLGNMSKIYFSNWTNINYFNYTLSGVGNIGNYWNDFPACSATQTLGIYKVCTNPANYSINSTNNIYDFAPLIIAPEYISPTPTNNTNFGGTSFTIRVEDTQGVSTWFNVSINGNNYPLTNISSTQWEYTITTDDFVGITNVTFNVSYEGNGIMETRVFTFYPNHASEAFPVHTLLSGLITIMLILIGGFYLNKK